MSFRFPGYPYKRVLATILVRSIIFWIAIKCYKNPSKAFKSLRMLKKKRENLSGMPGIPKFFYANSRFFFNPNIPGAPSLSFKLFIINELNNSLPFTNGNSRLTSIIFSITKKCPLRCDHCFEWDRLNNKESLSLDDLKNILRKVQAYGISQIQIGGGEPMTRLEEMILLLKQSAKGTDFWLLTSGYNLTYENAIKLKKAGLTGVRISIDHWEKDNHNEFRGNQNAFEWAIKASENSREAGLAMGLALCINKSTLNEVYLMNYLEFAKSIKASFILLLEPRETGHYKDKDVRLPEESLKIVDNFYLKVNSSYEFESYPVVIFPGYHQRKIGCFGAGIRYLYIDSNGSVHACPFCQQEMGNSLEDDLIDIIPLIRQKGCHIYPKPENAFVN